MKKITFAALLLAGFCVVASPKAVAQDNTSSQSSAADSTADAITNQQLALLRRDIRSIKKQLIAANLTLADSEATKFWQVYEQYSAETEKINDARTAIIKEYSDEYGTLNDAQADSLSPLAGHGHRTSKTSSAVRADLPKSLARKESSDLLSTRPPHQHDDRRAAYIAASSGPKPGLNFLVEKRHVRDRETNRADRFCADEL